MTRIMIALLFLTSTLLADVKSITGQIKFDTQMDNQAEMTLNGTGLGIGVTPSTNLHVNGNAIVTKQVFVGGNSGSSNLNVNGTIGYGFQTVTSSTTLSSNSIILADSSTGNILLSLPEASSYTGRKYTIKKTSPLNQVSLREGGFIDSYSDISLNENNMGSISVISNSGNWHILNISGNGPLFSTDNLVGWWKLNEDTGIIAYDSSPNKRNGILNSTSFSSNSTNGLYDDALNFDGLDDVIITEDIDIPSGNNFSVSVWFNTTSNSLGAQGIGYLIQKDQFVGSSPYSMYLSNSENRLNVSVGGTSVQAFVTSNDGLWHHGVLTLSGNLISCYYDGQLKNSVTTPTFIENNENMSIGSSEVGVTYRPFLGKIDDVRVYNKTLNSLEIKALFNQGR